jgi:hypothetical protein
MPGVSRVHDDEDERNSHGLGHDPDPYLFGMLSAMQELAKVYVHFARMARAILEAGARHRLEPEPGGGVVPRQK